MADNQHTPTTPEFQGTHAQELHHNAILAISATHAIADSILGCPGIPHRAAGLAEALHAVADQLQRAATDFEMAGCQDDESEGVA